MIKTIEIDLNGSSILQAPNMSYTQMMSYVITTPNKHVIVIDGGVYEDAKFLHDQILKAGGYVDIWILTHCHSDHYQALIKIMRDMKGVEIGKICYNFPPCEWIYEAEPDRMKDNVEIYEFLDKYESEILILEEGTKLNVDGVILTIMNNPLDFVGDSKFINDTSLVIRIEFTNRKTALFLGDLSLKAGEKLADQYGEALKSDIVQMAHHGQNGVSERVYQYIRPEICLWPTPIWLWNNDAGKGFDTHHYKTVIVRGWMEKLGVKHHGIEGEGTVLIK